MGGVWASVRASCVINVAAFATQVLRVPAHLQRERSGKTVRSRIGAERASSAEPSASERSARGCSSDAAPAERRYTCKGVQLIFMVGVQEGGRVRV